MGTSIKIKMHLPVQSGISGADFMNIQEGAFLFRFFLFVRPKFCRNPANFGPSSLFFFFLFLFFPFLFLSFLLFGPNFAGTRQILGRHSFSVLSSSFSFLFFPLPFLSFPLPFLSFPLPFLSFPLPFLSFLFGRAQFEGGFGLFWV